MTIQLWTNEETVFTLVTHWLLEIEIVESLLK